MEDMNLEKCLFIAGCFILAMAIGIAILTCREVRRADKANAKWKQLSGE